MLEGKNFDSAHML